MSKRRLKNRKLLTEINVIPYVDISLVLLVIFMVATPFMIQGIDLDLPHLGDHPIPNLVGQFSLYRMCQKPSSISSHSRWRTSPSLAPVCIKNRNTGMISESHDRIL